jgi:hypothetical protein
LAGRPWAAAISEATGRGHVCEPIQAVGFERGQARHADRTDHVFWEQRGARQRVRTAAGVTHDGELLDAELIGDTPDVGRRRRGEPNRQLPQGTASASHRPGDTAKQRGRRAGTEFSTT